MRPWTRHLCTRFLEIQPDPVRRNPVCKKADHVAILCNGLKNDLIARGIPAPKITPVFNGVNPLELKPVPPDPAFQQEWDLKDKKVIGFVGSFYRYEGLDLLITAFAKIAASHDNARLLQSPWKPWPWKKPWWPVTWAVTRN